MKFLYTELRGFSFCAMMVLSFDRKGEPRRKKGEIQQI